jgi:hypothetical protein
MLELAERVDEAVEQFVELVLGGGVRTPATVEHRCSLSPAPLLAVSHFSAPNLALNNCLSC